MDPPDAEADARRPQPVGERQRDRLAAARDHDPVHLHALDELLEDRLAGRRRRERLVQVCVDVVDRLDAEDAALAARVGGLQHGGEPDLVGGAAPLRERCGPRRSAAAARRRRRAGARIATLCVIRCAVSTPIPGSPRASATAATTGTARSARHREHAVELQPRDRLQHRADVGEVDDAARCRPRRGPSASGLRSTAATRRPELLRPQDRAALVAARRRRRGRSSHEPTQLGG